jgi:hypothetical protein
MSVKMSAAFSTFRILSCNAPISLYYYSCSISDSGRIMLSHSFYSQQTHEFWPTNKAWFRLDWSSCTNSSLFSFPVCWSCSGPGFLISLQCYFLPLDQSRSFLLQDSPLVLLRGLPVYTNAIPRHSYVKCHSIVFTGMTI